MGSIAATGLSRAGAAMSGRAVSGCGLFGAALGRAADATGRGDKSGPDRQSRTSTGSAHALTSRLRRPAEPASLSSFRSVRRRPGAWAAALAVLAGLALAAPAAAHQPLVGNANQTANLTVGYGALDVAQGFTTGSNPNGYDLAGVRLQIPDRASGTAARVATGLPDRIAEVATLTALATSHSDGSVYFRAPANTQLASDTTYWLVIQGLSGELRGTSSPAEDIRSAAGWSIADNRLVRTSGTTGPFSEVSGTDSGPITMRVYGHVTTAAAASEKSPVRRAMGTRPTTPTGLSASLNGDGLAALSQVVPAVVAKHRAPQSNRLGRGTDSGAYSDALVQSPRGITP